MIPGRKTEQQSGKVQLPFRTLVSLSQILSYREDCEDASGDIEVVVDVGFAQCDLGGRAECGTQPARVIDAPRKTAELSRLRIQPRSIPEFDGEVARVIVAQQFLNNGHRLGR